MLLFAKGERPDGLTGLVGLLVSIKHFESRLMTPPLSAKSFGLGERRETSQSPAAFPGSGFSIV